MFFLLNRGPIGRVAIALLLLFLVGSVLPLLLSSPVLSASDSPTAAGIGGCLGGTKAYRAASVRIGFVLPTFTITPYANYHHSFYAFYQKYWNTSGKITTDLGWFKTRIASNWSSRIVNDEKPLYDFLISPTASRCGLSMGENMRLIDDVAVDSGSLFAGKSRLYDVLILGHEEYVTKTEFGQLMKFVADGGRLVAMSGNTFWGQVNYSRVSHMETFVAGHGFQFNGKYAVRSGYHPFFVDARNWFGSAFSPGVFHIQGALLENRSAIGSTIATVIQSDRAFTSYDYPHDEVNYLTNSTGTEIVARFYISLGLDVGPVGGVPHPVYPVPPVVAYLHMYGKGLVACLCIFGQNLISYDKGAQTFLVYNAVFYSGTPLEAIPTPTTSTTTSTVTSLTLVPTSTAQGLTSQLPGTPTETNVGGRQAISTQAVAAVAIVGVVVALYVLNSRRRL